MFLAQPVVKPATGEFGVVGVARFIEQAVTEQGRMVRDLPKKLIELPSKWVHIKRVSSRPLAAIMLFLPTDERYREPIMPIMPS